MRSNRILQAQTTPQMKTRRGGIKYLEMAMKSLFVDFLNNYIGPPNCVHYGVTSSYEYLKT